MRGSSFFDGVSQTEVLVRERPVRIPTFYYDGTGIAAVFPARLAARRRVMPDPRFTPARLAAGLGAVGLLCVKYRDSDIGP